MAGSIAALSSNELSLPSVCQLRPTRSLHPSIEITRWSYPRFAVDSPQFTAHFAISTDHGVTSDNILETFLSPDVDHGDSRQRVWGDYQQVKAVGSVFNRVFVGNGVPFGRPFSNMDLIFFRVTLL